MALQSTACKTCSLNPLCLPVSLSFEDIDRLDEIIKRGRPIQKGEHLYHQGDAFTSVFAVRTGTLKTYTLTKEGEEQITGFHLASEMIGLSSYDVPTYQASAKALETTNVCEIPVTLLDELSNQLPDLRRQIMRIMGREIREDQQMMMLLSKKSAEERVASFLLSLAHRFKRRGYSERMFRLTMSRSDMANFLGLAVETVSRVFTRFQNQELISFGGNAKEIHVLQHGELCNIASLSDAERLELGLLDLTNS